MADAFNENDGPIHISEEKARDGQMMKWPLGVLIVSTIAAAIGLGLFLIPPG